MRAHDIVLRSAAAFGLHVSRRSKHPKTTLLGLGHRRFDTVLDVGANSGQFAIEARSHFPAAKIVCFEPLPGPFAELERWAKADGNAVALNLGLGDENAQIEMHLHVDHPTSSSLLTASEQGLSLYPEMTKQHCISVPVRRLDEALADRGIEVGDGTLLKLDVQGYEEHVLRGGAEAMRKVGAMITEVCIDKLYEAQADFYDLARHAERAGLRYAGNLSQALAEDGHVIFLDAVFIR